MVKVDLKFRKSNAKSKMGILYYQVSYRRKTYRINSGYRISDSEWDGERETFAFRSSCRDVFLQQIQQETKAVMAKLESELDFLLPVEVELKLSQYTRFSQEGGRVGNSVFGFLKRQTVYLNNLGRTRSGEIVNSALRSFIRFRKSLDLPFLFLDKRMIEQYEAYLRGRGLQRNTTSFYMRALRAVYHKACDEGLTWDNHPFSRVYTGIDKTVKRAVGIEELRRIQTLDLSAHPSLELSRDLFLFSFFMRGISFVDMAYLRKQDLQHGYISYRRRKTGQLLIIKWTVQMQRIVDKYPSQTSYLLPIIQDLDGTERRRYQNLLVKVNRDLKKVGRMAGLNIPLSTYVSRHSWASIARGKNIPLAVISEGLGHNNESTTQIYLDSIQNSEIDKANQIILGELL